VQIEFSLLIKLKDQDSGKRFGYRRDFEFCIVLDRDVERAVGNAKTLLENLLILTLDKNCPIKVVFSCVIANRGFKRLSLCRIACD
jgi:hypothetical protein